MEKNIQGRTDRDFYFPSPRGESQTVSAENSRLLSPLYHIHDNSNSTLGHQNNNMCEYQQQCFQIGYQSSNFNGYRQNDLQVNNQTLDSTGYQQQSRGGDIQNADFSQSYDLTHQNGYTSGCSPESYSLGLQSPSSYDGFGQAASPVSNMVHKTKFSGKRMSHTNTFQRKPETSTNSITNLSPSWNLPAYQNVSGGASLPNNSPSSHHLQTATTADPLLDNPYENQQFHDSVPLGSKQWEQHSLTRLQGGGGDANLLLPPEESWSTPYSKQQTCLPRFQQAFRFGSEQIPDSCIASDGEPEGNLTRLQVDATHQNLGYKSSSYEDKDSLCDLFENQVFFEELDKKTSVVSNIAGASPRLHEPNGMNSQITGTMNSPISEILDSPRSEGLYSPYNSEAFDSPRSEELSSLGSEGLSSPGSEALSSPCPENPVLCSTTSPYSSGSAVPKQSIRGPRKFSNCSSISSTSSSSSANSSAATNMSKVQKKQQRNRLKNAEYKAMSPEDKKKRDLEQNKIASHKCRVETKKKSLSQAQICRAAESDNRTLNASESILEDQKTTMINAMMAQGYSIEHIINLLRSNGVSESLIKSLFQSYDG